VSKLSLLIAVLFLYGCSTSTKMETEYFNLVDEYARVEYIHHVKESSLLNNTVHPNECKTSINKKIEVVQYYKKCMKKRKIDKFKQLELLNQQEMVLVNYIQALKADKNIPKAKEALEDNFKSAIKRNEKEK